MTEKEQIRLTKKRWLVLLSSCLINLCIGALYVWSVFAGPMAAHLSEVLGKELTAANLAIVFSIGNSTGFITMIGGGFLNQKLGPRWVVFLGGVLFGLGFLICGFSSSVAGLIIGYGVVSGLAMGLAYGCTISNSVKFFPDKAGLIGGIATASYGISSVILPPIANTVIDYVGVSKAFMYFGIVIMIVCGIFSQFILKCPEDFVPVGYKAPVQKTGKANSVADKNWKEMLTSPIFYVMWIMLFFGAVLGMMSISQASGIAQNMAGMTAANAALIVSVLALFNTFGRIAAGSVSDKIGCIMTLRGVYVLAVIAMGLLYLNAGTAMFCIGICMVGVCFGAFMGVYPGFTAGQFGRKNSSVNYGIMFTGFNLAGLLGPIIISRIYSSTNSYKFAFVTAMVFAIIGFVLTFVYGKLNKNQN